ncbi:MAG: hypothetical protein AB1813_15075 [Verrucomicrobiota bacterium]
MNFRWAICLHKEDAACLGALRLFPGIEAAAEDHCLWVRGARVEEPLDRLLRGLPAVARFEWLPHDRLRRIDRHIPYESFPNLRWQTLKALLPVVLPSASSPATPPPPVSLRLVRSAEESESALLLTSFELWKTFARNAPKVRLDRLQFALNDRGEVLVLGKPLPPLPGRQFARHGNIAVPSGFLWQPAVSAEVLARRLALPSEALALWFEDGTITQVHFEQFVPAQRSAICATAEAFTTTR